MAPREAKLPLHDGWQRTRKLCQWPWYVKSTLRKARSSSTQTWIAWGKLIATYNFAASPFLHYCTLLGQQCLSSDSYVCCTDVGPNGPNNKHSLEEHLWHVASTTSTVASLPVARLGWLPGQAKLPLHDGWQRTRKLCHSSWNVKSTIKKAQSPQHKPASPWENWSLPTSLQLHFFALHSLHLGPFRLCELVAVPKVVILTQLPFAVEMWAQKGQITNTAWQNTRAKLPVQL